MFTLVSKGEPWSNKASPLKRRHMQKYAIARYYFNSLFKEQADRSFVNDLMDEPYIEEDRFSYALGNIQSETYESIELTQGTFGRVRKGSLGDVYNKSKKEFISEKLPDVADITLHFIINHKNHLIFVEYDARYKPEHFAEKFAKIYSHNKSYGELQIDFIVVEQNVYEEIQKWDRIEKVTFSKLRPSNPSSLDDFAEIEKLLKETRGQKAKIEIQASPLDPDDHDSKRRLDPGLDYESTLIKQGLALSSHGYGEAKITGIQDGKEREVESKRFLKKVEVDFREDGALGKIVQTIEEIGKDEKKEI